MDQLTFIFIPRYVKADGGIVERFFDFVPIKSHKAEYTKDIILKRVSGFGLDIKNCGRNVVTMP